MVLVQKVKQLSFDGNLHQVQVRTVTQQPVLVVARRAAGIEILVQAVKEHRLLIARNVGQELLAEISLQQVIAQLLMQCGQVRELAQRFGVAR
ncbi:hypothetical protein D3C77_361430 [compost metagenome]